jgi:hypothetical protein
VWQGLNDELEASGVDVVLIGIDVNAEQCHQYMDRAQGLVDAGRSVVDTRHEVVGALGLKNVPMSMWIDESGVVVMDAHHSPVVAGWGDRPIPEGLPPRMEGRLVELKKATDRHQEYLAALRSWAATGVVPVASLTETSAGEAMSVAAFEMGDHFRLAGNSELSVHYWRKAHELDPDNWAAKRQAWSLVTTAEGAAPDLIQEDTGPYDGNWLDDLVAVGGIDHYYPPSAWRS